MLSNWARVQRSAVEQCEQPEDDVKKHQPLNPAYPVFCVNPELVKVQPYSQVLLSSILAKCHSYTANRLCSIKPANKGELGTSAIQHAKI